MTNGMMLMQIFGIILAIFTPTTLVILAIINYAKYKKRTKVWEVIE